MVALAALVTLGFAAPTVLVGAPADPGAARDLVTLMRAGERGSWSVDYEFTRTLAGGRVLRQAMQEARDPSLHVLRSGSVMSVVQGRRTYDCNATGKRLACTEAPATKLLAPSEVLRVAVSVGAYTVTRIPGAVIAGQRARCFRARTTGHGQLPDLGVEADMCLDAHGVSLRQRIVSDSGDVDERLAESVTEPVTTAAIRALARGFDPGAAPGPG